MPRITVAISVIALSAGAALGTESSVPFINADDVHALGITGRGVTVAVIDAGIYSPHPGLAGSIAGGGVSIINGQLIFDGGAAPPGQYHGTRVSLIITDATGVAPNAKTLSIRIFDASGQSTVGDARLAIDWARLRKRRDPTIRVINLSLSFGLPGTWYPCTCDHVHAATTTALSEAAQAGIITFAATGNDANCGGIMFPACVSGVVRVAASYDDDYGMVSFESLCTDPAALPYWVACFSNIAEDCDYLLAAPGYDITVGGFAGFSGTSLATPHCSGVAALMFEKNRCGSLDAASARTTIFNTATVHDLAFPYCALSPQPRHVNALAAVDAVAEGPCSMVLGDLDCDGTVSLFDFREILRCLTGPQVGPGLAGWLCACADRGGAESGYHVPRFNVPRFMACSVQSERRRLPTPDPFTKELLPRPGAAGAHLYELGPVKAL